MAEKLSEFFINLACSETSHAKHTPDLTHIADNMQNIPRLPLKKSNPMEVKKGFDEY